ncbi:MAG: hypothetical protein JWN00_6081 [Actinomycetia bacterium]|nr:hypothetical protein [Actinomycetes bacterium]
MTPNRHVPKGQVHAPKNLGPVNNQHAGLIFVAGWMPQAVA